MEVNEKMPLEVIKTIGSESSIKSLQQCEDTIEAGLKTFVEVGQSLMYIKDNKLYKSLYSTFGDYTKERWDFTQQHARRLITASKTVKKIESEPNGSVLPTSESQARVLAKVDDPVALWKKAQDETGKDQPTANEIAQKMEDGIEVDENLTKDKDSHTVLVPSKNKERTVISINKEMAERKAQMLQLENEVAELEKLIPIGAILERDPTQCYIRNRVINVYESIEDAANSIGVDVQELYGVIYGGRAAEVCGSIWWVQEQEDCN